MYQILIADDEKQERQVIRFLLDKYQFPVQITEASNGREALKLLEKRAYDILLTDIKMPFVDGLALAENAREHFPDMLIIFFSGYDDFDYVKQALSLHVVNYILKPVNPEEFSKTISSVLAQLKEREEQRTKQKITQNVARNHVLYQIINRSSIDSLRHLYPYLDFRFVYDYHRLILIQMEKDFFGNGPTEEDTGFFPLNLKPLIPKDCDFINLNPAQNLLLFSGAKHHTAWYEKQAEDFILQLRKLCGMDCFAAVSAPFSKPEEIPDAYEEAERALADRLFFRESTTTDMAVVKSEFPSPPEDDTLLKSIEKDIQLKDSHRLRQHIALLFEKYKNPASYSRIYIRFLCTSLLKLLLGGLKGEPLFSFDQLAERIYSFQQLSEIADTIWEVTEAVTASMEREQQSPRHAIHLVKQYIYRHFNEELCLDLLAEQVYLSPRYLSTMFIQETGYGINKFIKSVRMDRACDLLLHTNMKITDICHQVGYSNVSYFCKSFLEDFGTTPEKFRQKKEAESIGTGGNTL